MIVLLVFLGLLSLPSIITLADDPAPGFLVSMADSRRIVCERASVEEAKKLHPGVLAAGYPRGDFIERSAVLCAEPIVGAEQRNPRDAAILSDLSASVQGLTAQVAALPGSEAHTWMVEVHYPNPAVVSKVSFAAKGALLNQGLAASDRLPVLGVGDIEVLSVTPPLEAYAMACRRYFAPGRLEPSDAVLSLLVLDSRETTLHAGACVKGRWTWLR